LYISHTDPVTIRNTELIKHATIETVAKRMHNTIPPDEQALILPQVVQEWPQLGAYRHPFELNGLF